jgi:DNA-binding transcriptional LysR family regulator
MALNLHLVRLFVAVATHHSFSRAAEALNISQPAVSKGVLALERQVGLTLLDRSQAYLPLTEAGQLLLDYAQGIFADERLAETALAQVRDGTHGHLALGASHTIGIYLLPQLISQFHRQHPNVRLTLDIANTRDLVQHLIDGALDLMLAEGPVTSATLVSTPWQEDRLVVIAPPRHIARQTGTVPFTALANELFLLRETGSGTRAIIDAHLAAHHLRLPHVMEVSNTEAIKQLVAEGLGLAIIPASTCQHEIAAGKLHLVDVPELAITRQLWRVAMPQRPLSPSARAFAALL